MTLYIERPMNKLAISFDVEDWFCVRNMSHVLPYKDWKDEWIRVDSGLDFLLDELRQRKIKATFFVLGWLAEKRPEIVKKILANGHELGSHGYNHQGLDTMTQEEVYQDVKKSLQVLGDLSGNYPIQGYRAPSFSVTKKTWFVFDIFKRLGLKYDSSVYPVYHPDYGVPDFGQKAKRVDGVLEIPLNYVSIGKIKLPISGGGYFRLLPYALFKFLLKKALKGGNVVLYFHPWEFDPEQPRVKMPLLKTFRHYVGLNANRRKFQKLLNDFSFIMMKDLEV